MSYNTLMTESRDPALQSRVLACVQQEAWHNATLSATPFGATARGNAAAGIALVWPVCLATEGEYASALAVKRPNPGADEAVISDPMILAAVQANWPT